MNASFDKGEAVEEWVDRRFFRPIGLRIARALLPTAITPDQVTLGSLILGLIAGRLCFYPSPLLNGVGVLVFILSDILDSADGQLARMRGTSTRFGRVLDGLSDTFRFGNLYIQLMVRMVFAGDSLMPVLLLGVSAGIAHSLQSKSADFVRQAYRWLTAGQGEFDLPEDAAALVKGHWWQLWYVAAYRNYLSQQVALFPRTTALVRAIRSHHFPADSAAPWWREQAPLVRGLAWIGQNIRFALLALLVVPGAPALFFWVTLLPMSAVMLLIISRHELRVQRHMALQGVRVAAIS